MPGSPPEPPAAEAGSAVLAAPPRGSSTPDGSGPGGGTAFVGRRLGIDFWLSVAWIVLVILVATFANLLPFQDPTAIGANEPKAAPDIHHLLGTDELGRDLLSRVVYGARVSLVVGFSSIAFGMLIGGGIGLLAGFYRGRADTVLNGLSSILLAFPGLIFLLSVVTFLGQNLVTVTLGLGILSIAPLARVIRGNTIAYANREFVLAARALGARNGRILIREILPNVLPGAFAFSLVAVAINVVVEGALSFLGLSVRPPTPTWGGMISEGGQVIAQDALVALWPSLAMFLTVLALNFAGDRLQTYFQIREGAL